MDCFGDYAIWITGTALKACCSLSLDCQYKGEKEHRLFF